jgi:hypothetical protein
MNAPQEVAPYLAQDAKPMPLASKPQFSLAPRDLAQAIEFAGILAKSNMVPKEFVGNPGNILVAVQWGMELGLQPMQAMQNIAVINGRPSLWGDAVIGIVKASPACEYVVEEVTDTVATCRVKRRGEPEQCRTFTMEDAAKAGLKGKQGPWSQYPKRMMQMRARSWALRDVFPDVLRGMPVAEEVMDYAPAEREINPAPAAPRVTEPQPYPADQFEKNLPAWRAAIAKGKPADQIIAMVSTKGLLSEEQKDSIRAPADAPDLFEQIKAKIEKADSVDVLDVAGDLIGGIEDMEKRKELSALYQKRADEMMNG